MTASPPIALYRRRFNESAEIRCIATTPRHAQAIVEPINRLKANGKSVVVFTLNAGNADFPFSVFGYHAQIMPTSAGDSADWQSGIGADHLQKVKGLTQITQNGLLIQGDIRWRIPPDKGG